MPLSEELDSVSGTTAGTVDRHGTAGTFESTNPATGAVVGVFPVHDADAVRETVEQARAAAERWAALGFAERRLRLAAFRGYLARRVHELADLVHRENGKPHDDAILEITLAIDHLAWAAAHAPRTLGPRRVRPGLLAANQAAYLEYQPLGVVGVIGPWNYPVFTPMGSIAYALAAGNAVVFKPSEFTPAVGAWLAAAWRAAVPDVADAFQLVTGYGETGAALCRAGVGKLAFTGSAATGRKVMATCAETLTPVLMELGGKDAMIVDDDADVVAAADAAVWGAMSNAGQTCIGIERVYATSAVYDRFVSEVTRRVGDLDPGSHERATYGPMTMASQTDVVRRHVADAVAAGGTLAAGGTVDGGYVAPTVLLDVPESSAAVREETFGPTLTITRVADAEEGLTRANASSMGLGGSVFSGSTARAMDLARRMRSGMTAINSVLTFASVPALPFGGVGESGFGRIHGEDGLREFSRAKAITRQRFPLPVDLLSFSRPAAAFDALARVTGLLHGRHR
ncbi:aldehyde dehydrogenase family protein [Modestobacter versicolor]|uniref:Aldehyde dehydrogenase n=2 Tax=Modestobacter versicolor TaxID=429133 RepID=A0A323VA29_9ACTN|nr:aldehyde dehydrogenase family protein [Modestobacter versicolor]MBB3674280.1 acyl-CoA reductase-like NAD-dependent aldehyde dehydrogenase [Modestobacter versicolor]PZA20970.1 aldehyde dehydrogenase [Modestobacter versicolor]